VTTIPVSRSLVELLRWRAQVQKDSRAYTFLPDGETEGPAWSYGELDRKSRAIAATLQDLGAPGERALLLYPAGLDFLAAFFGCLYAGVTAVPSYPPHPARPARSLPRLQAIARDAAVRVVLGSEAIVTAAPALVAQAPALAAARWRATEALSPDAAEAWQEPSLTPDTLAFLQYTSGSTGMPKGVMVSHGNLLHNLAYGRSCADNDAERVGVCWLPAYHDMGLIEGILQPLFAGYPTYLMPPAAFLQRPARWLEAISRVRGTNSGGPNFAYALCVRKTSPEQRAGLDLGCWQIAYSGAEPIRKETLDRFADAFGPCGFQADAFYPAYGLAEATLVVTSRRRGEAPVFRDVDAGGLGRDEATAPAPGADPVTLVGCGRASGGTRVVIAHPEARTRCAPGVVGEVWVSSPSVARGYWDRPADTRATFGAYLADSGEGPFLRTGDLGFLAGDQLFVTGRLKDVIIVRGRKHYPEDLELTVERSHAAIRPGGVAAFALDAAHGERVVVLAELNARRPRGRGPREAVDGAAVIDAIRQAVAEQHDLRVHGVALLAPGAVPKTSSGKLRRHACRSGWRAGTLETLARWDPGAG